MNLLYPYTKDRHYGTPIPITSPDQMVPLYLTTEWPTFDFTQHRDMILPSGFAAQGMWYPPALVNLINLRASKESTIERIREYLLKTLDVEVPSHYVNSVPTSLNNRSYPSINSIVNRASVFSGDLATETVYSSSGLSYYRKGLVMMYRNSGEDITYTAKGPHYPFSVNITLPSPVHAYMIPRALILIQAKHLLYVRTRGILGLPMSLPFDAFRILINNRYMTLDAVMASGAYRSWASSEGKDEEFVSEEEINKYLVHPSDRVPLSKPIFVANLKRELAKML